MSLNSPSPSPAAIEHRIRQLVDLEGVVTFTTLSTRLPDCRWITLFRVLNHLEKQNVIRLIPIPWDYEISIAKGSTSPLRKD